MKLSYVLSLALGALLLTLAPSAQASSSGNSNGCGHTNAGGFRVLPRRSVRPARPAIANQSTASNAELTRAATPQNQVAAAQTH